MASGGSGIDFELHIQLNIPRLPEGKLAFPVLAATVGIMANVAYKKWQSYAQGERLPNGRVIALRSGAYLKSINIRPDGDMAYILWSDAPHAAAIEFGTDTYDMKKALATSARVRRTKDGRRYLIIPFRWGTPGRIGFGANVMTRPEHAVARLLSMSTVIGQTTRESGNYPGRMIPQSVYKWGDRLKIQDHGDTFNHRAGRRMQGMVRFDNPGGGQSHYLTFRTMMEGSPKWIRPAKPGLYPARSAIEHIRSSAEKAFEKALQADVNAILGAPSAPAGSPGASGSFWSGAFQRARSWFGGGGGS